MFGRTFATADITLVKNRGALRAFDPSHKVRQGVMGVIHTRNLFYKKRSKKWSSLNFLFLYSRFLFFF